MVAREQGGKRHRVLLTGWYPIPSHGAEPGTLIHIRRGSLAPTSLLEMGSLLGSAWHCLWVFLLTVVLRNKKAC